jgi:hypothetical protein
MQLEIQKPLVEDADILRGEVGEVHGGRDPGARPPLAHLDPADAQKLENLVDRCIGWCIVRILERCDGTPHAVLTTLISGCEQPSPVTQDGQRFVGRTLVNETEERKQPRPCAVGMPEPFSASSSESGELLPETLNAITPVVDYAVSWQQIARLSKKDNHTPHHDARRSDVEIAPGNPTCFAVVYGRQHRS